MKTKKKKRAVKFWNPPTTALDAAAADSWLMVYEKEGDLAYHYHSSGHHMDGFRNGVEWVLQQLRESIHVGDAAVAKWLEQQAKKKV